MKNVLLTGVSGGMGRAAAKLLIDNGFTVYGIDIQDECDIENVIYFKADIGDDESLEKVFDTMKSSGVSLDAIAHMAGMYDMNSLVEISESSFKRIFDVNFFSMFKINKFFFPLLNEHARIVMVSSELAPLQPLPFTGLYGITKSAVEKYAFSLRMELNLLGYDVVVIRPGAVATPMIKSSSDSIDKFCANTVIYGGKLKNFEALVNGVKTKTVPPQSIAKILLKALRARKPKLVYNINRNFGLMLLNFLPARLQLMLITFILKIKK